MEAAAQSLGQQLIAFDVSNDSDIEAAFATSFNAGSVPFSSAPVGSCSAVGERLVALAARYGLPATLAAGSAALAGGLMSYGASTGRLSSSRHLHRANSQGRETR